MSSTDQIDFSTLTWVKSELDETLNRAKEALKAYVEDSEDTNQLQFCVTYLHQVQGTLKMVELYGASMVAEEMEFVAKDLIDGNIKDQDAAYDILLQSILRLPDYLERIELGHKDVPIVLLPLVNDLRAVRSKKLLSESALFNPNLTLGVPDRLMDGDFSMTGSQLKAALTKIRTVYQISLLNWIKQVNGDKALSNIQLLITKLQTVVSPLHLKQLFWVYSAVIEGLRARVVEDSISVKQVAGQVDSMLHDLISEPNLSPSKTNPITKNLLYFVGSGSGQGRLISEVKNFFELEQFIPDEEEIKHAEGSLSGKNKDLLQTVSEAINDDILVVQESLDLYIRNKSASSEQLVPLLDTLQKIADTLGILGLGVARESVLLHQSTIKTAIEENSRPTDEQLLDVAKSLLMLESQLGDHIQSLGGSPSVSDKDEDDHNVPKTEQMAIVKQLAKESIVNLQQIKANFVAYIESPWDKIQINDNPKLLQDIAGALKILQLNEASEQLYKLIEFVKTQIIQKKATPSAVELDQLATTISTFEYYLENLDQGNSIQANLIEKVSQQVEKLQTFATEGHEVEQVKDDGVDENLSNENTDPTEPENQNDAESEDDNNIDSEVLEGTGNNELNSETSAQPVSDSRMVTFGDDVDDEFKEIFLEEYEEELANLQNKYRAWKTDPENHADELGEMRRIFHTLKGSGRMVGAELVGEFGWQMENMCNRFIEGGIALSDGLTSMMDSGVVLAGDMFNALKAESSLPIQYDYVLENANKIVAGETSVALFVAPTTEVQESELKSDELSLDNEDLVVKVDEPEAAELLDVEDTSLEDNEVEISGEGSVTAEASEEDDLSLDLEEFALEDDEVESTDEESVTAEASEEDDLSLDLEEFSLEDDQVESSDEESFTAEASEDDDLSLDLEEFSLEDDEVESSDEEPVTAEASEDDLSLDLEEFSLEDDEVESSDEESVTAEASEDDNLSLDLEEFSLEDDEVESSDEEPVSAEALEDDDLSLDLEEFSLEDDEVESSDEESVTAEASEDDDLSLDLEEFSLEDDEVESSDEEPVTAEASEEDDDLSLDLEEFSLEDDEVESSDEEPVSAEASEEDDLLLDLEEFSLEDDEVESSDEASVTAEASEEDDDLSLDLEEFSLENDEVESSDEASVTEEASEDNELSLDLEELTLESDETIDSEVNVETEELMLADEQNDESIEESDDLKVDPVFVEILQNEVGGHLSLLQDFVDAKKPRVTEEMIRVVHTLNGAASMAEVSAITHMATPLEKMAIILSEKDMPFSDGDMVQVELATTQAKHVMSDLAEGEFVADERIGDYFAERIIELKSQPASEEVVDSLEESVIDDVQESETKDEEAVEAVSAVQPAVSPVESQEEEEVSQSDFDYELLEILTEEANEIFDRAEHLLTELEEKPEDMGVIQALQRDLHTLKGGARMAGLNQIGDLSHQLESLFESIAEKEVAVTVPQHEMMSSVMDKLHGMVTSDDYGQLTSIEKESEMLEKILSDDGTEIKEESQLDKEFFDPLNQNVSPVDASSAEEESGATDQAPKKKSNVLSGGQIKVNSELLDKLVNFAGEVSIYRSRMEQQSAELKLNIDELENTVERVRRLLRELEHETEAQIISTYQHEGDELEEDFDPLELDQFSTIQQLSRSLAESVSDLSNIQNYLQESARSSETLLLQQSRVNTELQEGLMETRLVTFNSLVPRLRRVLRTASSDLGIKAKLSVKGAEGEMDKTVLEGMQAPLEHMIRNSMAHGIEKDRKKAGKPEQGNIEIALSREATEVVVTVSDDGGGINTEVVKAKAIERGIIDADTEITDQEVAELITHSGLSAADEVTKLAGRGVGMDVVSNEIKRLGGGIEIISRKGEGTTFVIRLPYTLALTQAIVVQVADHRYAIPASGVEGLIRMNYDEFKRRQEEGDLDYDYAGDQYRIQELNKLLSVDSEAVVEGGQVPLVMIKTGDQGVALRVDQTYGGREIVVKGVGTQVGSVPGIFGATILGDGAVVLILDIIPMHRSYIQKIKSLEEQGIELVEEVEVDETITVMVVDDSITMRRAGERMLTRNDFEVLTAKDGLDALNKLQEQVPDLMLLDIEMPRMDGFELATQMKQSDKFRDIPIIMITSRTGQKHKDRAKEIGVERYLGKPYQEIELIENINDLLNLEDVG